ncbi:hypothetical protein PF007_g31363, partial [Phytophthora fragariae]
RDVPAWFSEAFESDGYDSEAVALVLELPEKKLKARTEDRVVSLRHNLAGRNDSRRARTAPRLQ